MNEEKEKEGMSIIIPGRIIFRIFERQFV